MNKQLGWQEQIEKRSKCINESWNDQTESVAIIEIKYTFQRPKCQRKCKLKINFR